MAADVVQCQTDHDISVIDRFGPPPRRERYVPNDIGPSPDDWLAPRLEQIASLITNGFVGTATPHYTDEGGVKYLYGSNVRPNKIDARFVRYVTRQFDEEQSETRLKAGDLLTVQSGHIGETAVVPPEFENANCHALILTRLKPEYMLPEFAAQYLNSEIGKARLRGLEVGSTILHINTKDLKRFRMPLPSLAEQRRISEILSTWDRAVETIEALIANARGQNEALMQSLLTAKRRLPGFAGAWTHRTIREISTRVTRRNDGAELPVLTISSTAGFVRQDVKYRRFIAGRSVENYIVMRRGEFAYNKGNSKTYQFGCVFDLSEFQSGLVPHVYVCFRLKEGYSHRFYKALFEADYLAPQLGRLVNTGVRNNGLLNITAAQFLGTSVPVPPLEEQVAIAAVMETAAAKVRALDGQLAALQQEKAALMQQLLTGKRRVKVDQREAA